MPLREGLALQEKMTIKHRFTYPQHRPAKLWHESLDVATLPSLRPNTLLISAANPYGERASGLYMHEVDRPLVWATILAVPWLFNRYISDDQIPLAIPGNSIVFTRFRNESLGVLRDKEGRTFDAELVHFSAIECYFNRSLVQWDYTRT